jgi:hypothetical protein
MFSHFVKPPQAREGAKAGEARKNFGKKTEKNDRIGSGSYCILGTSR